MKLETRYVFAGILGTAGCLIWYKWPAYRTLGTLILCFHVFMLPSKYTIPKWNAKGFFSNIAILLGLTLFLILITRLPEELLEQLLTWYFMGLLWLLFLCMLTIRFIKEREKAQQPLGQASPGTTVADEPSN